MSDPVPLLTLQQIRKSYGGGDAPQVDVLRGVSLSIHAGEFVAIVGASGSGKSTLMNILGCLDRPSAGQYLFCGHDVSNLDADQLAWLRREAFGFVFQGYHLIRTESALENVEIPAVYAGVPAEERHRRGAALLERLGLEDRLHHRPSQLSGGQQQRVSIARALMNGGRIILADEPTGALDTRSGKEVMELLDELSQQGHTIILITHDREVAARARRIIEIRDGEIISDSATQATAAAAPTATQTHDDVLNSSALMSQMAAGAQRGASLLTDALEACRAAWRVMWIHRFRTALTLLGIVIGVASVIVMLGVGEGAKEKVIAQLGAFGSNLIYVYGQRGNPRTPGGIITREDVHALSQLRELSNVMPSMKGSVTVRRGNVDHQTSAQGVGVAMTQIQRWPVREGVFFSAQDENRLAPVVVLGQGVRKILFADHEEPIGSYVLLGSMPFRVIGILSEKGASSGYEDADDVVVIPFTTASARVFGRRNPDSVVVAVADVNNVDTAEKSIQALLMDRHRIEDFRIRNRAAMIEAEAAAQDTMSQLLAMIAAISLLVGGIGVMNVMLMTVKERTREIGIRIATGARQSDVLRQFLTEAVLVSTVGGAAGVLIGLVMGVALIVAGVPVVFSLTAIGTAFGCAVITGLVFGFMPAQKAARLDPVVALTSD